MYAVNMYAVYCFVNAVLDAGRYGEMSRHISTQFSKLFIAMSKLTESISRYCVYTSTFLWASTASPVSFDIIVMIQELKVSWAKPGQHHSYSRASMVWFLAHFCSVNIVLLLNSIKHIAPVFKVSMYTLAIYCTLLCSN